MYPTHDEMIEFIHLLGYPNYFDGICFGLSATSVSPVLMGTTTKTNERLQKIKKTLDMYKASREEGQKRSLRRIMDVTLENDEKIDILAYCENVALHHKPIDYTVCFPKGQLLEQNLWITNNVIEPIELSNASGLAYAGAMVGHYRVENENSDIGILISSLDETLRQLSSTPSFACVIYSGNHAIHIGYCAIQRKWCYFKINQGSLGYSFTNDIKELQDIIESEFFKKNNDNLCLTVKFYCLAKDKLKITQFHYMWNNSRDNNLSRSIAEAMQPDSLGKIPLITMAENNDLNNLRIFALLANREEDDSIFSDFNDYTDTKEEATRIIEMIMVIQNCLIFVSNANVLNFFLNKQFMDNRYILHADTAGFMEILLKEAEITPETREIFFMLCNIVYENEKRKGSIDFIERITVERDSYLFVMEDTILDFFSVCQSNDNSYILQKDVMALMRLALGKMEITIATEDKFLKLYNIVFEDEIRKKYNKPVIEHIITTKFPGQPQQILNDVALALLLERQEEDADYVINEEVAEILKTLLVQTKITAENRDEFFRLYEIVSQNEKRLNRNGFIMENLFVAEKCDDFFLGDDVLFLLSAWQNENESGHLNVETMRFMQAVLARMEITADTEGKFLKLYNIVREDARRKAFNKPILECIIAEKKCPHVLNNIVLDMFLDMQEDKDYVLHTETAEVLKAVLVQTEITAENKQNILKLYIILRENERRSTKEEYHHRYAAFFRKPGTSATEKINAARALLRGEPWARTYRALQSGRLGKIAAFFLSANDEQKSTSAVGICSGA